MRHHVQVMKNEPLRITYSYWDGQGHRRTLIARKGDTVLQFLQKVKEQLLPDFRDMRRALCLSLCPLASQDACNPTLERRVQHQ